MSARIMIADEVAAGRVQWRVRLSAAQYHVSVIDDLALAVQAVAQKKPDLVLLSDRDVSHLIPVCQALKETAETKDIPLILVGPEAGPHARLAALAAGADDLLETPVNDAVCLARIRSLLRARDGRAELLRRRSTAEEFGFCDAGVVFERPGRVALVAHSRTQGMDWRDALVGNLRDRVDVLGKYAALSTAESSTAADVYVIDLAMNGDAGGLQLLSDLRARAETRRASVLAVVDPGDDTLAVKALDLGASGLIPSNFKPKELAMRVRAQIKLKQEADALTAAVEDGMRLAATDSLTGLYNRRYAMTHARRILSEAKAAGRPVALLIGDLDHFKSVNDTYGHAAGDTVLTEISARLRANLRGPDVLARIGGEEFLIIMSETDSDRAAAVAKRVCEMVAARPVVIDAGQKAVAVTMSIGVATSDPSRPEVETVEALLERADQALYAAKAAGRNQVTVAAAA